MDCGRDSVPVVARGLCQRCYLLRRRNGRLQERPTQRRVRPHGAERCVICKFRKAAPRGDRCALCSHYYRKYGRERPTRLDRVAQPCRICGAPRSAYNATNGWARGRCPTCRKYWDTYGTERSKALQQKVAPHGWCDCGNPASGEFALNYGQFHKLDGATPSSAFNRHQFTVPLCAICAKQEQAA